MINNKPSNTTNMSLKQMWHNHSDHFCRILIFLLVLCIFFISELPLGCFAWKEEQDSATDTEQMESGTFDEDEMIIAGYYDSSLGKNCNFSIPYNDDFFQRNPDIFYLDMAQLSYGLTITAFRSVEDENTPRDYNVQSFLEKIGFENFQSYYYDDEPAIDTIASAIATKKIGDKTVIAFICNGADYGDEWEGNLTVGKGNEHEGFSGAASICEDRLLSYIEEYEISGDIVLWTSGHSRASAIDNLLAARMMETNLFSRIYGYFFCTPNNTREPVNCSNLFNIVSQNDYVPQIPFTSWGYGRNGTDLYLPAQESNSAYYEAFLAASEIYNNITSQSFHNNPELNQQFFVTKEFVDAIFNTVDEYVDKLQPELVSMFETDGTIELLSVLQEALNKVNDYTTEQKEGIDALEEYLSMVVYKYISGNYSQVSDGSWNSQDSLGRNLIFEHLAITYGSWLFSVQDPTALFQDNTRTLRLAIKGNFDLEVSDSYGLVQTVSYCNEEEICEPGSTDRRSDANTIYLYATNHDGNAIINIPADSEYTIKLYPKKSGNITLISDTHSYQGTSEASDIMFLRADYDQVIVLTDLFALNGMNISDENGNELPVLRQNMSSGIRSLIAKVKLMEGTYTVEQVLYAIAFFVLVPLILMAIVFISFCLDRKKQYPKSDTLTTVCLCLLVPTLIAGAVIFYMLLPNIRIVAVVYGLSAIVFIIVLVFRGKQYSDFKKHRLCFFKIHHFQ